MGWTILAGLVCVGLLPSPTALAQEQWFLMSRHGECAKVGSLKRKVPDMGEINDPDSFAGLMRKKGYEVTSTRVAVPKGNAREVKVPKAELFLLFVTPEMCGSFEKR
jgi:hypothetical protein